MPKLIGMFIFSGNKLSITTEMRGDYSVHGHDKQVDR